MDEARTIQNEGIRTNLFGARTSLRAYLFLVLILAILAFVVDPPQTGNLFFGILFVLTLPLSILAYPLTLWSAFLLFGPAPLGPLGNAFVVFIWEMCAFVQMVVVRMVARSRPR